MSFTTGRIVTAAQCVAENIKRIAGPVLASSGVGGAGDTTLQNLKIVKCSVESDPRSDHGRV